MRRDEKALYLDGGDDMGVNIYQNSFHLLLAVHFIVHKLYTMNKFDFHK